MRSSGSEATLGSPKLGSTRRNYFRKDQVNKALVDSLRKSRDSEAYSQQNLIKQSNEEDRMLKNISKHDQTLGFHEHHDSQHEESGVVAEPGETKWHDV